MNEVNYFFNCFFIEKCAFCTQGNIKLYAGSIKKFYKSMEEHEIVPKKDYDFLCYVIKEEMEKWLSSCAAYDDGTYFDMYL